MKKKLVAFLLVAFMLCLVLVGCGGDKSESVLANAKEYLEGIMTQDHATVNTPGDYTVLSKLTIDGVELSIEWSVNVENGVKIVVDENNAPVVDEDGNITVDVDENAEADIPYTLTAKIKYPESDKFVEASFNYTVPKFKELTWSEFQATENDEPVVIKGVVTGIVETSKENDLYIQDENGGYFAYALAKKPSELGIEIGMTVRVRGIKDVYYGVHQVKEPSVEILSTEINPAAPLDITTAFINAENLKGDDLTKYQSMLVTIKGATVLGQNSANDTYYDFTLGGKTAYVRISSSTSMLSKDDETAFKASVASNIGYAADVTGLVSIYSGNIYLVPVTKDAFSNFKVVNRTPEEQVEFAAGLISVTEKVTENATIELPTTNQLYKDVVITWALTENACATLTGNKLKIVLPDEETTLTLTATIKSGSATTTKTFTVKVNAMSPYVAMPIGKAPVVGEKYKFALKQKGLGSTLFFAGEGTADGLYLKTTTDATLAVDVFLEAVEGEAGKYYFAFMDGAAKYYINVAYNTDKAKVGATVGIRPETKFVYDATIETLTTTVTYDVIKDGKTETKTETHYIGTYNTYDTFSCSMTSYAGNATSYVGKFCTAINTHTTSDEDKIATEKDVLTLPTEVKVNGTKINLAEYGEYFSKVAITWALGEGVTGATIEDGVLVVNLEKNAREITVIATLAHGAKTGTKTFTIAVDALPTIVPVKVDTPVVGTGYKLALTQGTLGQFLYFNGTTKNDANEFLNSTADYTAAPDVFVEEVSTGNFRLYFMNGGVKTYIEIYLNASNSKRLRLVTEPTAVWTWDSTLGIYVQDVNPEAGEENVDNYYIGTYSNFDTFSPSGTYRLEDPSVIGVSQFVAYFYTMTDLAAVSDADKVATEKGNLNFTVTEITEAGTVNLPTGVVTYNDVTITWAVSASDYATLAGNVLTVTLPAVDGEDVTLTLTATLKAGTTTDTKTFTVTIKAPTSTPENISDVLSATAGSHYVAGVVVAANDKSFIVKDATGMILVYLGSTPSVAVGDVVTVKGTTSDYAGNRQFGNTGLEVNKTGTETVTHPNATVMDGEALTAYTTPSNIQFVQITGTLNIGNGYYNLVVDGTTKQGSLTYLAGDLKTTADALNGQVIVVTGYATGITSSKYVQLVVVSVEVPNVSDAEKVENVKNALTVGDIVTSGTVNLPLVGSAHSDVTIAWALAADNTADVTLDAATGVLTVTLKDDAQTIKLVATLTCGEVTDTKEVTVTVKANDPTPLSEVLSAEDEGTYKVAGTVVAINGRSFVLQDATDAILVYLNAAPSVAVGDVVTIIGTTTTYNGNRQFGNTNIKIEVTGTETVTHPTATVVDGTALDAYVAPVDIKFVEMTGILSISGTYYNLAVDGASKMQGSLTYLIGDLKTVTDALNGKVITVKGYTTGISSGKYVNLAVTSVEEANATDAQKVAIEKGKLTVGADVTANVNLPTAGTVYTNVTVAWAVSANDYVTVEGGVLTVNARPAANTTVTLTATLTSGEASDTKEFTVTVVGTSAPVSKTVEYTAAQIGAEVVADGYTSADGEVKIVATTGTNTSNNPVYSTQIRVYSSSKGYNIFTVEVAEGYRIKSIVLTVSGDSYAGGTLTLNEGDADWSSSASGTTVTITQVAAGSDNVLALHGTAQLRITNIVIEYEAV